MTNSNNNLQPPKVHPLWVVLALAAFGLMVLALNGCSPLRHYKEVASDSDLPRSQDKRNILAGVLAAEFPIQELVKEKDSLAITHKKDSVALLKHQQAIKNLNAAIISLNKTKPKNCPPCPLLNVDSLLINNMIVDTVYVDRWHSKIVQTKDTIGNFNKQNEFNSLGKQLQDSTFQLLILREKKAALIASNSELKSDKHYWKIRFFILLFAVIGYVGLRIYFKFKPL
jgi:hypothetical protein